MIGSVVHVHHIQPDIRWYPRREWTKFRGQMEGTTILRAPRGFDLFFHSIFVHIPHHVDMRIPFYGLEPAADGHQGRVPRTRSTTSRCASVTSCATAGPASSTTSIAACG